MFQAVRELGENGGSNLRTVAKFIASSYDVELDQECDLSDLLKIAAKKSLTRGLVIHNAETSSFKAVVGRKGIKRWVVCFLCKVGYIHLIKLTVNMKEKRSESGKGGRRRREGGSGKRKSCANFSFKRTSPAQQRSRPR